jgi:pSer/pThr/pTyr-binding forkhead associated (FHA) protein
MAALHLPDGHRHALARDSVTIGRDPGCDIALADDAKISRTHAEVRLVDDQWTLFDLKSRNGTWVNQRRIDHHPLRNGDALRLGDTVLRYVADVDPRATEADERKMASTPDLSEREAQVLSLLAQGLTDKEIGEQLFISTSTVRSHLDRISSKTGLRRRAELTRLAIDVGIGD